MIEIIVNEKKRLRKLSWMIYICSTLVLPPGPLTIYTQRSGPYEYPRRARIILSVLKALRPS